MNRAHSYHRTALTIVWGLATVLALLSPGLRAQQLALSEAEILQMLRSGESPQQIEALARDYGISFEITESTSRELRAAGATTELIDVLRTLSPKPAAPVPSAPEPAKPPVLFIESTPGGAQVYVDDEPVGKTSGEGRLKLTQLAPAEHRVRVSLDGHRDYEQKLQMAAGETVRLVVKLEPLPAATATRPRLAVVPRPTGVQPSSPAQPDATAAFLGLKIGTAEGDGLAGVPILEVQTGSPAEEAGLKVGQKVLAVDGQTVLSPADVVKAIRAHRPGEKAEIVYDDGKSLSKAVVRLGATQALPGEVASPAPAPAQPQALASFNAAHNHSSAMSWCYGTLTVGDGKISYHSSSGEHSFDFPLNEVREVQKNPMYLRAMKGFHIRMVDGSNYNFALPRDGKWVEPSEFFAAIEAARAAGETQQQNRKREIIEQLLKKK